MADITVLGDRSELILTPGALAFVAGLHREFGARRTELLAARQRRRAEVARTGRLDFLPETAAIRDGDWQVAPAPADLQDRRVEMTGPADRKMTINALNSGARVWLADLEDASTPHWHNVIGGQVNLYDAIRRTITFASGAKEYALATDRRLSTIVMRPRGWHLDERHLLADGVPVAGSLVDFGLYFFHNAAELLARGSGPYFYLPKLESHLEARLWNDIFVHAQDQLGIPQGSVRATVLIETIPAAFEMDEILYELRDHASGLNAGRWDYLFSVIKYFRDSGRDFVLPDRNAVTMTAPFLRAYTRLLVRTCHRRGALAMGGMAAFIPSRQDPEVNRTAVAKVRADKQREAADGFDGSWVAHPDLVPLCREVFDGVLGDRPNQVDKPVEEYQASAAELIDLRSTPGEPTDGGLRNNVRVGLLYVEAWLRGNGAVAIDNLMEDAATAEIARSQIWQWVHNEVKLDTGEQVTAELVERIIDEEVARIGSPQRFGVARRIFADVALADTYADFLTLPAYDAVLETECAS
ncbi:malate synthase A [Kribbella shirazensis]|uniref:Malate synthase n=1 Tax=Kribbella shirazensis TaxID=1105143 RepID=A0A7X5VD49_9ACTN|nr:malate synthase A [Kribbella shirazensis]NIK58591.1 malate synthase [Kribbella shirazensis]